MSWEDDDELRIESANRIIYNIYEYPTMHDLKVASYGISSIGQNLRMFVLPIYAEFTT